MTLRDKVKQKPANEGCDYAIADDMAEELAVSSEAAWKALRSLQDEGPDITEMKNRGCQLPVIHDMLTESGISDALPFDVRKRVHLVVKDVTGSTNDDAKALLREGAPNNTVVVASRQTMGKGRRGRSFFSPSDSGIYVSVILAPDIPLERCWMITGAAAVATCRAISDTCKLDTQIKWVNDVYMKDRKVCGILTEGIADLGTGDLSHAVVGIGVNVYEPHGGFPPEIKSRAAALSVEIVPNLRNRLVASIVTHLLGLCARFDEKTLIGEYRALSMMPGRHVGVLKDLSALRFATAIQINDDMSLRVRYEDGSCEDLQTGEVSIVLEQENVE